MSWYKLTIAGSDSAMHFVADPATEAKVLADFRDRGWGVESITEEQAAEMIAAQHEADGMAPAAARWSARQAIIEARGPVS